MRQRVVQPFLCIYIIHFVNYECKYISNRYTIYQRVILLYYFNMNDLNKKIKELRVALGLTQSQFAEKLKLTQSNLSAIEGGKREVNLNVVMNIKEAFKIDIEDFLYKKISQIDIYKQNNDINRIMEGIKQDHRIEKGIYQNDKERMQALHERFTKKILEKYQLEEIEDFINDFWIVEMVCSGQNKHLLINSTKEAFALFHNKLITKKELLLRYKEAIRQEKELFEILQPYYETLVILAEKIYKFEYGDIDIDD